jgi:hypothetical protein
MMRVMRGSLSRLVLLAVAWLATGCAQLGWPPEAAAPNTVEGVVAEVRTALRANDAERRRALADARTAQRATPDAPAARARLGLLLALLPSPHADPEQAEALLAPLAAAPEGLWSGVASIALAGIAERRRLEARARQAETRAAEAERGSARAAERAQQAEARAADAERKLEAMKAIERRVMEREVPRDLRRR